MRRIAALLFAVLMASGAAAQERYPSQPVTLISPYPPGGAADFLARTLAEGLKGRLNQTVIVQNVGGAGGTVGTLQAARAKPDGYTLLLHHIGMSTIPALYKKLTFDPLTAFEFVGVFAEAPMMFVARRDFPPRDFAELVAYAKARREKATVAAAGMGSVTHLCAMLFQEALGVPLTIVQYKGGGPAMIDVRSGQVDFICDLPTTNFGAIRAGDLKAYALAAPRRMATMPDVPTTAEVGMPGLVIGVWFGLYAPRGTPAAVMGTLNKALRDVVADKAVADQLAKIETFLLPLDEVTPEAHRRKLASQLALWGPIIEKAGIQAE
ncbi:MAG TPA: tripartite tricarboxylate transporter substrate-binding protein [Reyranella sp.]|nr:tripartite tricarboxylate transporter substrate-binding protein [Reyranella sp.]